MCPSRFGNSGLRQEINQWHRHRQGENPEVKYFFSEFDLFRHFLPLLSTPPLDGVTRDTARQYNNWSGVKKTIRKFYQVGFP
jgi:hypothetical protein